MMDEQMYIASCYTFRALTTALYNFGLGFDPKDPEPGEREASNVTHLYGSDEIFHLVRPPAFY